MGLVADVIFVDEMEPQNLRLFETCLLRSSDFRKKSFLDEQCRKCLRLLFKASIGADGDLYL